MEGLFDHEMETHDHDSMEEEVRRFPVGTHTRV
jgi:hypothetical protein